MRISCSECGQELIGAVNRCWRCGRQLARSVGPDGLPPLRRAPPRTKPAASLEPVVAQAVALPASAVPIEPGEPIEATVSAETALAGSALSEATLPPVQPEPETVVAIAVPAAPAELAAPWAWREWGAIVGLAAGICGFFLAWFAWWPIAFGFVAVAAGVWGLGTSRSSLAIAAILAGCVVLAIESGGLILAVFQHYYKALPWQP